MYVAPEPLVYMTVFFREKNYPPKYMIVSSV
jgi:hypothetical protein